MIRPWSPLSELSRLEQSISSLFDDLWREFTPRTLAEMEMATFPVDVVDQGDTILVRAELPGVDKENIDVRCTEDSISIASEKRYEKQVEEENWIVRESAFGKMVRTVGLGTTVDPSKAEAKYENGVLTITLPKTEPAPKGHSIEIK
ncbi:MAG TPA: Hsp20/alpha crystallin family protein [Bacillota bacterium]|nr:Hsp20/alpha crystallin family protein [Bacillota bacterium]